MLKLSKWLILTQKTRFYTSLSRFSRIISFKSSFLALNLFITAVQRRCIPQLSRRILILTKFDSKNWNMLPAGANDSTRTLLRSKYRFFGIFTLKTQFLGPFSAFRAKFHHKWRPSKVNMKICHITRRESLNDQRCAKMWPFWLQTLSVSIQVQWIN